MKRRWRDLGHKPKTITEFGDFQTPLCLAESICALLSQQGLQPHSLLEPTCGYGNLLFTGVDQFPTVKVALGNDVNTDHLARAQTTLLKLKSNAQVSLEQVDFFEKDWSALIAGLPEPILLLGNPPWVTNAHLSSLGSQNLPVKSNFQKHQGLDAKTGKANFDISEWMIIRLMEAMTGRVGTLAMLCKSAVARKALHYAWKSSLPVERSAIYRIDALTHFDASVDAVLLVTHFQPTASDSQATVYPELSDAPAESHMGFEDDLLLADVAAYRRWKHLCGTNIMKWRSGIKHDCSRVMELRKEGDQYRNGFSELISLEDACLYPMLKSSEVAKGENAIATRWMLVPQTTTGEDTSTLRTSAPRTWAYLNTHAELLNKRASSIYRGRPSYSVFGVGPYSFAPWKVAISGFYKKLAFVSIGPLKGKPVMLDDTSYFLPFEAREQADFIASLLNSSVAKEFFSAFVYWDAKRPITVELLKRLDLSQLAQQLGQDKEWYRLFNHDKKKSSVVREVQPELWATSRIA